MQKKKKLKNELLEDLQMLLLNFNLAIIYIILVLLKINWVILKIIFSNKFLGRIIDFYLVWKKFFFSQHIIMENPRTEKEKIIKDIRNLFSQEKELK